MSARDEFEYPLDRVADEALHAPEVLPEEATAAQNHRHAESCAVYQERAQRAFRYRARKRGRGNG